MADIDMDQISKDAEVTVLNIIKTTIRYRWNKGTLYVSWKDIATELEKVYDLWFNERDQLMFRKSEDYRSCVYWYVENKFDEIVDRAKRLGRTPIEYIAYGLGVNIKNVAQYFRQTNKDGVTGYQYSLGNRDTSEIRKTQKRGQGDCAVRAWNQASGISYDETLTAFEKYGEKDPTNGTNWDAINAFAEEHNWKEVSKDWWQEQTLHTLLTNLPELRDMDLVVGVPHHIFFVEKGIVKDGGDYSFEKINALYVREEFYDEVSFWILHRLSISGLVDDLLELKREKSNRTWKSIANEMKLKDYHVEDIRRTTEFRRRVRKNKEESKWVLPYKKY